MEPNAISRRHMLETSLAALLLFESGCSWQKSEPEAALPAVIDKATLERIIPAMKDWIAMLLDSTKDQAVPVTSLGFTGLSKYYPSEVLEKARVVFTEEIPQPPLAALGVKGAERFLLETPAAITYKNTYFMLPSVKAEEAIHFHELVHTVQYDILGLDGFVKLYGHFMIETGYEENPLEVMARKYETKFAVGEPPFNPVPLIQQDLTQLVKGLQGAY